MKVVESKIAVSVLDSGATTSPSGLHLVQSAETTQVLKGTVVAFGRDVGPYEYADEDTAPLINIGDIVHFNRFDAIQVTTREGRVWVLQYSAILIIE